MMNASFTMVVPALSDPDRALALPYVAAAARDAVHAIWALDEALGRIVAGTTEPMIGQMRMTWWHDRLSALDRGERAAEPVLIALAAAVDAKRVTGAALAALVAGWELLLEPSPIDGAALGAYAAGRGGTLFALTCAAMARMEDVGNAGSGWAAMDLARRCDDAELASRARALAARDLSGPLPRTRPLRILATLARGDAARTAGVPRPRLAILRAALF